MTPLCDIGHKYGTDKCPQIQHFYTPFYYEALKDKPVKKVLEMGIGYPECMDKFYKDYKTGASLYMWRDFFPNAQIYGADIEPKALFEDERIKTFLCDETKEDDIKRLIEKTGSDIDVFIDDGAHYHHQQVFLCQTVMPLLPKDVFYAIEDVYNPQRVMRELGFKSFSPNLKSNRKIYRDNLVVVKNETL